MSEGNYYESCARAHRAGPAERYPGNHVRFSWLLAPLALLNHAYLRFGGGPLAMREAFLREYDAAAPFDSRLGSKEELARFRVTVEKRAEGLEQNPHLSGVGRALIKLAGVVCLQSRRRVLEFYDANVSFIESRGRIKAPIIITGLPRTGSTLLQRLLGEDPNTRSPRAFEMNLPLPPLEVGADPLCDPRIKRCNTGHNRMRRMARGFLEKFSESHHIAPDEFEESFTCLLAHNGINIMNMSQSGFGFIDEFLQLQGKAVALRYERLFFTMLDAYCPAPSHWTLKSPLYASLFPLVFEAYPDARVVLTHRHPLVVLPSVCRMMESWCIAADRNGVFDKYRFGEFNQALFGAFATVPLRYREANPEKERQIFDCMYDELFADPIAMVKRIYACFDLEVTPVFEQRMKAYLQNNRQGKYGRHRYSLEEYGIDPERYFESLCDYMDKYGFRSNDTRPRRSPEIPPLVAGLVTSAGPHVAR